MITIINDTNEQLSNIIDFMYLLRKYLNPECEQFFVEYMQQMHNEIKDLELQIEELKNELEYMTTYNSEYDDA